ncbi:hypothetical protein PTSG_06539 [Salpingoeca rosetta]|uniref:J domain-containing protein n=1 Tax=Salpingoeca rosetta (strain ATCC 50818 / BSB-021) TaxID=946362 RepID=F2UG37_SALR5|nr:uncharacterized protein PTSG_06539 [Salpingoeca rosetta]EGD75465.1 hypothetical protein PTSG_06539 [Salpingoeca rosetta]|eukprot:XP_004991922.1 hypothetical protein PTSG_06539 [Salpingoeca rosetta]
MQATCTCLRRRVASALAAWHHQRVPARSLHRIATPAPAVNAAIARRVAPASAPTSTTQAIRRAPQGLTPRPHVCCGMGFGLLSAQPTVFDGPSSLSQPPSQPPPPATATAAAATPQHRATPVVPSPLRWRVCKVRSTDGHTDVVTQAANLAHDAAPFLHSTRTNTLTTTQSTLLRRRPGLLNHQQQQQSFQTRIQRRSLHVARRHLGARTHYDVLGVSNTASQADIKKAYIELSKLLHPDKTAHKEGLDRERCEQQYQQVTEAYNVLSRPFDRRAYDNTLSNNYGMSAASAASTTYRPPSYQHRDIYDNVHFGPSPYKVFSNTTIVMIAIVWMIVGIIWHYFAISKTKTELEEHLERLSREAAQDHEEARKRARENGYKKQLEILVAQHRAQFDDKY